MIDLGDRELVALIGFAGGIVLGLAARLGRFCTMGAIEDAVYSGDYRRARMWALAVAVAIVATFGADAAGLLDLRGSLYLSTGWNPQGTVLGGLLFGYGMALCGACGYMALARIGGGDIRALVIVIVMGLAAYMAMGGVTATLWVSFFPRPPTPEGELGIAHLAAHRLGLPPIAVAMAVAGAFAALALFGRGPMGRRGALWAAAVGLTVAGGWVATGTIADVAFAPVDIESFSFAAPLGESLLYLMTSTGSAVNFGIGSVPGVIVGAFLGSLLRRDFRWEACDDPRELRRQLIGAFLMGTGGVGALGCSIGQGMTAFSVLAISAPLVVISIVIGARLGLYQLLEMRL